MELEEQFATLIMVVLPAFLTGYAFNAFLEWLRTHGANL